MISNKNKIITSSGDLFFYYYIVGTHHLCSTDFHHWKMKRKWPMREARLSIHTVPKKRHASTHAPNHRSLQTAFTTEYSPGLPLWSSTAPVFPVTLSWPERSEDSSLELVSLQTQSASSLAQTEDSLGKERGQGVFVMCWKESRLCLWRPFEVL